MLAAKSVALRNSKHITPEVLLQLTADTRKVLSRECKMTTPQETFCSIRASGSQLSLFGQCTGTSQSGLWLPIDLFLEDAMDGSRVAAVSAAEILMGKSQFIYYSSEVILYLWTRLVFLSTFLS